MYCDSTKARLRLFALHLRDTKIRRLLVAATTLLAMFVPAETWAGASFQGMGYLPGGTFSFPAAISADGTVVVGSGYAPYQGFSGAYTQAARWTASGGWTSLGFLSGNDHSGASTISGDGTVIGGGSGVERTGSSQAFRWVSQFGMSAQGYLSGDALSVFAGSDTYGSVMVGYSAASGVSSPTQAFRWTNLNGMTGLGWLPGAGSLAIKTSLAAGVSADGSIVVGRSVYSTGTGSNYKSGTQAFRWTSSGGMTGMGFLSSTILVSGTDSQATAISADGNVIVGSSATGETNCGSSQCVLAFRWTSGGGMTNIGSNGICLVGHADVCRAVAVNSDGSVIVGTCLSCGTYGNVGGPAVWRWTASEGIKTIPALLTSYGINTSSLRLGVNAISADGTVIVGSYTDASGNNEQAYIAKIPLSAAAGVLAVSPNSQMNLHGPVGGPFASDVSGQITLSNSGTQSLNYSISPPNWLSVSPSSSGSLAGGASASVIISPGPLAIGASAGNYSSSIIFNNTTNGSGNTSVVTNLLVNQPPGKQLDANFNGPAPVEGASPIP